MVVDSAASRKSEVGTALSFVGSIGMSTNDFLCVSNQVPPGGICGADMATIQPIALDCVMGAVNTKNEGTLRLLSGEGAQSIRLIREDARQHALLH